MEKCSSTGSNDDQGQSTKASSDCKICGDVASGSHYNVLSCESCKIFFRRNAEQKKKELKCRYTGHCEINLNTRHTCSYCRLAKCFSTGMEIEKIRSSRSKSNTTNPKRKSTEDHRQTSSKTLAKLNDFEQLSISNILQSDHPNLTIDQWNLISNLSDCFDISDGLEISKRYVHEQNALPIKRRFKPASLIPYCQTILNCIQLFYKNNQDFLSLSSQDRSILLPNTIQHTSSIFANFIYHQLGLIDDQAFCSAVELITHPNIFFVTKRLQDRADLDMTTIKLFVTILSFSTLNHTSYSNKSPINLSNITQILNIQNTYIDLIWRYLIHKYNFQGAVIYFSELIRCLFLIHEAIVLAQDVQWFRETIDSMIQHIQQTININD